MKIIKAIGVAVGSVLGILLAIWILMFLVRAFSNSATTVVVEEVAPGVMCAKMVTADGAAISCWKD